MPRYMRPRYRLLQMGDGIEYPHHLDLASGGDLATSALRKQCDSTYIARDCAMGRLTYRVDLVRPVEHQGICEGRSDGRHGRQIRRDTRI